MSSEVQAVYFMEPKWTPAAARKWLKDHNYKPIKDVHRKGKELRYRIHDPAEYGHFTTHKTDHDVYLVIGWPKTS
jgi:hypothetical protein